MKVSPEVRRWLRAPTYSHLLRWSHLHYPRRGAYGRTSLFCVEDGKGDKLYQQKQNHISRLSWHNLCVCIVKLSKLMYCCPEEINVCMVEAVTQLALHVFVFCFFHCVL